MIRLPKPNDIEIGHEWYDFDTQAGLKVMTPDVSITHDYRIPGIHEDKLQLFDSRHEACIYKVQVVIGAKNGVVGIEW